MLDSLLQEIDGINRLKRGLGPEWSTEPINVSLFSTSFPQEVIDEVLVLNPAEKRSSTIHNVTPRIVRIAFLMEKRNSHDIEIY